MPFYILFAQPACSLSESINVDVSIHVSKYFPNLHQLLLPFSLILLLIHLFHDLLLQWFFKASTFHHKKKSIFVAFIKQLQLISTTKKVKQAVFVNGASEWSVEHSIYAPLCLEAFYSLHFRDISIKIIPIPCFTLWLLFSASGWC